ncbi:probable sodium/metabolite cotransporter BASS4, chloroplastic [Stylophora pistillata]|uniref:probable sodium/metabolite cotransporter BASS4, chloroplastic n=1 Tax=Stylophora pistillata TaxID=50429 RepID=UPI000C04C5CF|nr:probable sodium/metabolite cotransporter BASS4, chloroplastic [Stylophora pistillata]
MTEEADTPLLPEKQKLSFPSVTTQKGTSLLERVRTTIFKNLLPISLIFFVILGILVPQPGVYFSKLPANYVCVIGIFLHSGLKLKTEEVQDALKSFKAMIWGVVCILFITPVIGGQLTGLLPYTEARDQSAKNSTNGSLSIEEHANGSSILGPALFQVGMQVYFIVPCTISSGIILTAQAGGAVALSVLLTVFCNLAAVFTVPPLVAWIINFEDVRLDPVKLLIKLVLTVLLPLLVGKGLSYMPHVKTFVTKYSKILKATSIILLAMIPWLKVSRASAQKAFSGISVWSIFAVLGWGLAMHLLFIIVILLPCFALKLGKPALKSVVILASQKTLAIAVTICGYLPFTQAEQGDVTSFAEVTFSSISSFCTLFGTGKYSRIISIIIPLAVPMGKMKRITCDCPLQSRAKKRTQKRPRLISCHVDLTLGQ